MFKKIFNSVFAAGAIMQADAMATDYSTAGCNKYGQPEFVFSSGDQKLIDSDVDSFKQILVGMVAAGERFKDGETILVGSMVLKTAVTKDGSLRLLEPDMKSMPFHFVNSVANTLNILRRQRDAALSVDKKAIPQFAPLTQPLLIAGKALKAPVILMTRFTPEEAGGTGWLISDATGKENGSEADIQAMSIYEAMLKRPDLTDFLALPTGYSVAVKSRREFAVIKDKQPVSLPKDSYLGMLAK